MIAVGDTVTPLPGVMWCGRDIGGQELRVHHVQPYPAEVGGAVYVAGSLNGTPTMVDPHLQADQLAGPQVPNPVAPNT